MVLGHAGLIGIGQVARFIVASTVRERWGTGKSELHVWLWQGLREVVLDKLCIRIVYSQLEERRGRPRVVGLSAVGDAHVFHGCLKPVLTQLSFQVIDYICIYLKHGQQYEIGQCQFTTTRS